MSYIHRNFFAVMAGVQVEYAILQNRYLVNIPFVANPMIFFFGGGDPVNCDSFGLSKLKLDVLD